MGLCPKVLLPITLGMVPEVTLTVPLEVGVGNKGLGLNTTLGLGRLLAYVFKANRVSSYNLAIFITAYKF